MDIRQLQYFLSVVDHGSLGRAARMVHISEPALSKSIRRLEQELDVRLLDRGSRGMTPTVFGQALIAHARVVLGEIESCRREMLELKGAGVGTVRLGFRPSFGSAILPMAVARLQRDHARVKVVMREEPMMDLLAGLSRGDLDFVVATGNESLDEHLVQKPLHKSRVGILVSVDHPVTRRRKPRPGDLANSSWILPLPDDPIRAPLSALLESIGTGPLHVIAESNSLPTIMSFVRDNNAVAFFPRPLSGIIEEMGRLRFMEIPGLTWHREFHVISRRGASHSPAAQRLLSELEYVVGVHTNL